jgi:hypothetical protein
VRFYWHVVYFTINLLGPTAFKSIFFINHPLKINRVVFRFSLISRQIIEDFSFLHKFDNSPYFSFYFSPIFREGLYFVLNCLCLFNTSPELGEGSSDEPMRNRPLTACLMAARPPTFPPNNVHRTSKLSRFRMRNRLFVFSE